MRYRKVNQDGIAVVDYGAVSKADLARLKGYVLALTSIDPRNLSRPEQFVYWVNLYNAQILVVVLDNGIPVSIRDIKPGFSGILAGGPWQAEQFRVVGKGLSFNDIEHRILRPLWREPRVHFVLNCASIGCPDIPPQPLRVAQLEQQLELATSLFLQHPRAVLRQGDELLLSSIFDWFGADFGASQQQRLTFISRYNSTIVKLVATESLTKIRYHYDWSLNRL